MRRLLHAILFLPLLAAASAMPAGAQAVATHQAATATAATTTTPAKGLAGAIIPGSPLAALTGAPEPAPAADPLGTDNLGLSLMGQAAHEVRGTVAEFVSAVQRSTRLTPVADWLAGFPADHARTASALAAARGLAMVFIPGLLAAFLLQSLLARLRAAIIAIALARRRADLPDAEADGLILAEAGETEQPARRGLSPAAWLVRLGLAFGYIILALLPLVGFFIASSFIIGAGAVPNGAALLIVVGAANAYLFCRLAHETLKFILAPDQPDLRLVHLTNRQARRLVRGLMVIVLTVAIAYTVIAAAETLGLAHEGALVLARLAALAVHLELAVLVWQSRHVVAAWIRGDGSSSRLAFAVRPRLAAIWHYLALFYLIALWIAYAGGVQNAFAVLLRIILVFIAALTAGRLIGLGFEQLLGQVFDDSGESAHRLPALRARAKIYSPLLRLVARLIIGALVLVGMLAGWGLPIIPWLLKTPISVALISALIAILITIGVALVLWEIANFLLASRIDQLATAGRSRQASRLRTLLPMLRATLGVIIFLGAALVCLGKIGVNLVPLLAVSGVAGIAIGFGSQKLVQDIITGLFLLLEDAMQVGDVVTLASMTGTVERLSIRTIRLRGGDGSINIIPFSAVTTVTNLTRDFGYAQISIQVGYRENLPHVYAVLTDIARTMRAEPAWGAMMRDDLQIFGLDEFASSALVITGQIRTGPGQHWSVRREFYGRVKQRFQEENIEMPFLDMTAYGEWRGQPGTPPPA